MSEDIGALAVKIAMNDSSFQSGMQNLKRSMSIIDSSFKESIAGIKDWGNNLDGLKANSQALGDKINVQKQIVQQYSEQLQKAKDNLQANAEKMMDLKSKVEIAKTAWEQSKSSLGANDEATIKLKKSYEELSKQYNDAESKVKNNTKSIDGYTIQVNNANSKLKTMESELGKTNSAIKNFDKSSTDAAKAASKLKENIGESLSNGFRGIATSIAGIGAAIGGAFAGIYKLAEGASDLNESQNVVQQTFKKSSDSVIKWTDTISESAGIGKTAATSMVGAMGAMLKSSGLSEQAAGGMSEKLVQLSGDLASFYNLKNDDAWEKIRSGISGETEPLKQLGINMTVANLSAFALAEGIKKPYDKMSQAEQTQLRYNYLMKITSDAQGDFARTSGGMANQSRLTTMEMDNLKTSLGQIVMPAVNEFLKNFNERLKTIDLTKVKDALKWVVDNANNLIGAAVGIGAAMATWNVVSMISGVVKSIKEMQKANEGLTIAQAALNIVMDANPIGILITVIAGAVAAVIYLWKTNEGFRNSIIEIYNTIKSSIVNAINSIENFFTNLGLKIISISNSIKTSVSNIWDGIGDFFKNLWSEIKTTAESFWNGIKTFFTSTWNEIKNSVINIVMTMWYWINNKFQDQIELIRDIILRIKEVFTTIFDAIKTYVLGVVLLLCDLLTGNFTKLKEDAGKIFTKLKEDFQIIWDDIKGIFVNIILVIAGILEKAWNGIINTAKTVWNSFLQFMSNLWNSIKTTTEDAWNNLKNTVVNLCNNIKDGAINIWNGLINWFRSLPGVLYNVGVNMFTSMKNGVVSTVIGVKNSIVSGITSAINWIKDLPHEAVTWGKDMIEGIVKGIKDAAHAVGDAIKGVAQDIRKFLHFSVPDEGPLTDYESWMPDFMKGMAKGIENSKYLVSSAIKGLSTDMSIGMKLTTPEAEVSATSSINKSSNNLPSEVARPIYCLITNLDGREIARTIVDPLSEELGRKMKSSNLAYGG